MTQHGWIEQQLDGLPDQIRDEVAAWIGQLRGGACGPGDAPRERCGCICGRCGATGD